MTYIIRHAIKDRATPRCFAGLGLSHGINGWQAYKAKDALQAYYAMRSLSEMRDRDLQVMKRRVVKAANGDNLQEWAFYDRGGKDLIDTFWFKT